jgi:hypothetical protein
MLNACLQFHEPRNWFYGTNNLYKTETTEYCIRAYEEKQHSPSFGISSNGGF